MHLCVMFIYIIPVRTTFVLQEELAFSESNQQIHEFYKCVHEFIQVYQYIGPCMCCVSLCVCVISNQGTLNFFKKRFMAPFVEGVELAQG